MTVFRLLPTVALIVAVNLMLGGCGVWHGDKEIDTVPPSEAIGDGPGLFTGKRGGIILYER